MAKPIYESEQNRIDEERIITKFEGGLKLSHRKLTLPYTIDYALVDKSEEIKAWVECKRWHNNRRDFPFGVIGLSKLVKGLLLSRWTQIPFYLAVEWNDVFGYTKITNLSTFKVKWNGNKKRDGEGDYEPFVYIPIDLFTVYSQGGQLCQTSMGETGSLLK